MITVIAIIILILSNGKNIRKGINSFFLTIKMININYRKLLFEKDIFIRVSQCIMIALSELFSFVAIYIILIGYINIELSPIIKGLILLNCCALVYYLAGYILLISGNINMYFQNHNDNSMKSDFILSYFITSTFLAVALAFPNQVNKYIISGIIGVIICYVLNLKILLNIMKNPGKIKITTTDRSSFTKVSLIILIVVVMIIINLFLGVCLANSLEGAYSNNTGYFDLFYYTIVTFTTIGFGDIIPISIPAKIVAIVISATSILCITIFLGSIYSYRDKY
ncbi:potassium channel family protein [Clostridium sp. SHJSY1]|uniref:potassium channel family protein n=1 Tax=Clostridium sp. SHJSY1 TaxID=2942483 RepID=UPI00287418F5|nr:potassium channel family protein [Clostridium sp. SHJSY1]MDS0524347.1 potassium channel family protein [Clostridium sp. SHJSY1]